MNERFYRIMDNLLSEDTWLPMPAPNTAREVIYLPSEGGARWGISSADFLMTHPDGVKYDFSLVHLWPLVSTRTADLIEKYAPGDIERIAARFPDSTHGFEMLHVLPKIDCLDRDKSLISVIVLRPVIVASKVAGHHIFRIDGTVQIIVTELLKNAMEDAKITGVIFEEIGAV